MLLVASLGWHTDAVAWQLAANWAGSSGGVNGYSLERATGPGGTYAQIATTASGVITYTDSGVTAGTTYCYRNPLAFDPATLDGFRGSPNIRNAWYDVTCCPPNLERTFASLPSYFYSTSKDGLYVHLYDNSNLDWHLQDGTPIKVQQKTNYPWE